MPLSACKAGTDEAENNMDRKEWDRIFDEQAKQEEQAPKLVGDVSWLKHPTDPVPCPVCGDDMGYRPVFAQKIVVPNTTCHACEDRKAAEDERQREALYKEYLVAHMGDILIRRGVPEIYRGMAIDMPDTGLAAIIEQVLAGRSLLILGRPGRGKTTAAVAILKQMLLAGKINEHNFLFGYVPNVCAYIRDGIDSNSYEQRLNEYCKIPFLVLDDLSKESPTDNNNAIVRNIIAHRCDGRRQTIITSFRDGSEFTKRYDESTYSRVKSMLLYQMKGVDRRLNAEW